MRHVFLGHLVLVACLMTAGCGSESDSNNASDNSSNVGTNAADTDAGTNAGTNTDGGADNGDASQNGSPDATAMMGTGTPESEPNNGATLDETNPIEGGDSYSGTIDTVDTDAFRLRATPGMVYTVRVTLPDGSTLAPNITVLDDGRDGDAPGMDYVKIISGDSLQFLAMGEGGYLIVIRDDRNVVGGSVGGPNFTYTVSLEEAEPAAATEGEVTFGSTLSGTLSRAGDVHLWNFTATEGTDVVFDMAAIGADGRLFVFATETGSWIARQDDRSMADTNPLIDAPLFANGEMFLVVENIAPGAGEVVYTVEASTP